MIWKALSDPTRRSILDMLFIAPKTTGEISDHFHDLSRFAIMKHLGILEKADLIKIKREGKYRWNYLNPSSIKKNYNDWILKFQLQQDFPTPSKAISTETLTEMSKKDISTASINLEFTFNASKEAVWNALTEEIGQWWGKENYTSQRTKRFVLEGRIGGMMYEDFGAGEGLVWATVIGVDRPNTLQLKGLLSPEFGGPAISFLKIDLKETDKKTTLSLNDTLFGAVDEKTEKSLSKGWKGIFGQSLKLYLEN